MQLYLIWYPATRVRAPPVGTSVTNATDFRCGADVSPRRKEGASCQARTAVNTATIRGIGAGIARTGRPAATTSRRTSPLRVSCATSVGASSGTTTAASR